MDISRYNYEHFFLDFVEGMLSPQGEEKLRLFLQQNPDLEKELETFDVAEIPQCSLHFPGKEVLKKRFPQEEDQINEQNFEMFSVAFLENDLSEKQKHSFKEFIYENNDKAQEFSVLKNTMLKRENVVFDGKWKLKKKKPFVVSLSAFTSLAAAAAIALFLFFGPKETEQTPQIAENVTPSSMSDRHEDESSNEKAPVKNTTSTIKLVRGSKNPVPVSSYKKESPVKTNTKNSKTQDKQLDHRKSVASINLKNSVIKEVNTQFDKLIPLPISPASINRSSLNIADQVRYDYARAAKISEDEDVLIWSLASNGIKELNRLTGSDMKLMASKDQDGDISGIVFRSKYLQVATPIENEE